MYARLKNIWQSFRTSFWFVPSLFMIAATILSATLVGIDAKIGTGIAKTFPILELSPPAARSILSSIVGAMVTSTGVVFSITIVALSLASSQFGSRLIRTYRNRKTTHFTLGIFVSTSLYCILVLASIREVNDYSFVPITAVLFGILLTVVCLATLVYYIHDMSRAIQAPNVIQSSADDLHEAIDRLYLSNLEENRDLDEAALKEELAELGDPDFVVDCEKFGYVQFISEQPLATHACKHKVVLRMKVRTGDFIHEAHPIAEVYLPSGGSMGEGDERDSFASVVRSLIQIGPERTPRQDVRYAFNELVEIAVRALSPGINDPFTAETCVDQIHAALAKLSRRKKLSPFHVDDDGRLRLIASRVTSDELSRGSLEMIAGYANETPLVSGQIERALADLGT